MTTEHDGFALSRRQRRRDQNYINITPLVDVLLILLVLVMLAMPAFVKRLPVDLPVVEATGTPTPAQSLQISVRADGRLQIADQELALDVVLQRSKGLSVEVAVDRQAPYEHLANLLAQLQAQGNQAVSLMVY